MSIPRLAPPLVALLLLIAGCGSAADEPEVGRSSAATVAAGTSAATSSVVVPSSATSNIPSPSPSPSGAGPSSSGDSTTTPNDDGASTGAPVIGASTSTGSASTAASTTATSVTGPSTTSSKDAGAPITIRLRLDRRVEDAATEGFASFVQAVLTDQRGWEGAGFRFAFDDADADADYTVVLAEGPDVDTLCLPYDTFGRFSCQIGPTVALNADRWRTAVDNWPASLDEYRTMLVNHEVGHLLGQHHPASRCPGAGLPAPVMAQQSSGVAPCRANPWPLAWEIDCASRGLEPLAPPFERDITLTCGPDGPVG